MENMILVNVNDGDIMVLSYECLLEGGIPVGYTLYEDLTGEQRAQLNFI